jgi:hypothetical protein
MKNYSHRDLGLLLPAFAGSASAQIANDPVEKLPVTISGKPMRLGPGDVGVIGTTRAESFIVNIGRDDI